MRYTTILHEPRKMLKISMNDYCIADCIYHYANNPKNPAAGWCFASKQHIAEQIGITKAWAIKSIQTLEKLGLVVKSEDGRMLKTTEKWYQAVILKDYSDGIESIPKSVYDEHQVGIQSTPPSYNKNYSKRKRTPEVETSATQKPLFDITPEQKEEPKTEDQNAGKIHKALVDIWVKRHPTWVFRGPRDGKQIKEIIQQIQIFWRVSSGGIEPRPENVIEFFETLLEHLPDFYKNQDLTVINSKFGPIVEEIINNPNGKPITRKKQSAHDFIDGLQTH